MLLLLLGVSLTVAQSCGAYSCGQCNGDDSVDCYWCQTSNVTFAGTCMAGFESYGNGTCLNDGGFADATLSVCQAAGKAYVPSACEQITSCATCTANPLCSFCGNTGVNSSSDAYGICVTAALGKCDAGDNITSTQCAAFTAATSSICEQLTCSQCLSQDSSCNWCGSYTSGHCSTLGCPGFDSPTQDNYTDATCPGVTATTCENLECSTCINTSGCSFCGNANGTANLFGYGYCVTGTNACTHQDAVTTAVQCTALESALEDVTPSICDVLGCSQCISLDLDCSWCGTGAAGKCSDGNCPNNGNAATNTSICPVSHCENLSCAACVADPTCSYCSADEYQVCVDGAKRCSMNDAVTSVAQCASAYVDLCPLLTCGQCADSEGCYWCGTATGGRCSQEECDGTLAEIDDSSDCTASLTKCENITSCTTCVATPTCQFCSNQNNLLTTNLCVTAAAGACGNSTVSTAAECADASYVFNYNETTVAGQTTMSHKTTAKNTGAAGGTTASTAGNGVTPTGGAGGSKTSSVTGGGGATVSVSSSTTAANNNNNNNGATKAATGVVSALSSVVLALGVLAQLVL